MRNTAIKMTLVCISIALFGLFLANSSYAIIDAKSLVGMWLFNDEDDIAEDKSGNGNDGELMANPEWVDGKFDGGLEFDGSNYVVVPDSDSLDMTDAVTVMFWFATDKKMGPFDDRQAVVGKHYLEYEVGIYPAGAIHTYTNDGTGGGYDEGINTGIAGKLPDKDADWELGKWYHLAWTLDGTHETVYVNGVLIGEFDKPHEGTLAQAHTLEIGRRQAGSLAFVGIVDEVAIFNVALEQEDVQEAFERGLEEALGMAAVFPADKLATTWGQIRRSE
jgi:concanavalin A-like lectin/glucanase superfamily protein